MKSVGFSMVILFAVIILGACGLANSASAGEVMAALTETLGEIPSSVTVYDSMAEEGSDGYLSEHDFSFLYTGKYSTTPEWDSVDSFSIMLPSGTELYEIHIVKVINRADSEDVAAMMNRRVRLFKESIDESSPDNTVRNTAENAEIYIKGNFVFLIATQDNEAVKSIIEKLL